MLNKIRLKLVCEENIKLHTNMASLFHGFIMEHIPYEYAEKMHVSGLRPFTQTLIRENDEFFWQITTLNDEAYEHIAKKILECDKIKLQNKNIEIDISQVTAVRTGVDELFEKNYFGSVADRFVQLEFLTPTSFKMGGKYVFIPDSTLILSGLVKKFDAFSETVKSGDEQLLKEIAQSVSVHDFRISSRYFSVERVKIPGFYGTVTMKVSGSETLVKFVNMLADFAEFSGVGIKTALGMGAVRHNSSD